MQLSIDSYEIPQYANENEFPATIETREEYVGGSAFRSQADYDRFREAIFAKFQTGYVANAKNRYVISEEITNDTLLSDDEYV